MGTIRADSSRVARATTPKAPASAARLGEVGVGSFEIPAFLGRGSGHVPRFPRMWSFGPFSSISFLHILKQTNKKQKRK